MKTTVIYHRSDFDGLFCREIARKFLPDAELIGWDFGDPQIPMPAEGFVYILDLSPDCLCYNPNAEGRVWSRIIWIDHHKSAIEKYSNAIQGYRIDGVAACRLAWQWFNKGAEGYAINLPSMKETFIDRKVTEPLAVRLAGEYDIWDKRDPNAELFQHGLRSIELTDELWPGLLDTSPGQQNSIVGFLLGRASAVQYAKAKENESIINGCGFDLHWEGLNFLACNAAGYNSLLFTAGLKPEHDACLGFNWDGKNRKWRVSLYHAPGKEHHDLSVIAKTYGGGGHKGACGFTATELPFSIK